MDIELFWSLRSVAKHLKNFRKVWIVGERPIFPNVKSGVSWTLFSAPDRHSFKQHNVREKLLRAVYSDWIADEILLMNDDFYLLKDMSAENFPAYRIGNLRSHIEWRQPNQPDSPYTKALIMTEKALLQQKLPTIDFEAHVPISFKKQALLDVLDDDIFDWSTECGLCFRSLYGNRQGFKGERTMDVKIDEPFTRDALEEQTKRQSFLSTGPGAICHAWANFMADRFSL